MTHKEIKMEHVFNQFEAFLRSWHPSGANETPVAGDTRGSVRIKLVQKDADSLLLKAGGSAKMTVWRIKL